MRNLSKFKFVSALAALVAFSSAAQGQDRSVNFYNWSNYMAPGVLEDFTRETGIKVNQSHKGTGEIAAQLRAEAANPKTDIWWGGTGDPFLQAAEQGLLEA